MIKIILNLLENADLVVTLKNLYSYVTFRSLMAFLFSFIFVLAFGHRLILWLNKKKFRDTSGDYKSLPTTSKRGTPTSGGIIIILGTLIATLFWSDLSNFMVQSLLIGSLFFGLVGLLDDTRKIRGKSSLRGLGQLQKTILLLIFIVPFAIIVTGDYSPIPETIRTSLFIPFYKFPVFDLGRIGYILFITFTVFAIVNSVNITDGQDGLLSGLSMITLGVYCILAYIIGNALLSGHYYFPFINGASELTVFGAAMIGAIVGFLWFNFYPAEVFMGDTGSLTIGGVIAMIAVYTKQEVLFIIVGGVFVFEIFTSLVQEKLGNRLGRRIFLRAPYHHTLTHKGIGEPKTVMRLLLIGIMFALIGLLNIKLR